MAPEHRDGPSIVSHPEAPGKDQGLSRQKPGVHTPPTHINALENGVEASPEENRHLLTHGRESQQGELNAPLPLRGAPGPREAVPGAQRRLPGPGAGSRLQPGPQQRGTSDEAWAHLLHHHLRVTNPPPGGLPAGK